MRKGKNKIITITNEADKFYREKAVELNGNGSKDVVSFVVEQIALNGKVNWEEYEYKDDKLDVRQELIIISKEIEEQKEQKKNLLTALTELVQQIENEHCSEYIDELQANAKKVIKVVMDSDKV